MTKPLRCERERDGQLCRLVLDRPKANILDTEMVRAICDVLETLITDPGPLKLLVFEGAGNHFCFGASVEEHQPEPVKKMLPTFHEMFHMLEELSAPTAAVVRGQCLGGGMELALWCGRVFCDLRAHFGVPEVKLGVFPPIGSIILPWRTGGNRATQLVLSGQSVEAHTAVDWGLADDHGDDPEAAMQAWFEETLADKSAIALRHANRAIRRGLSNALGQDLPALEIQYLEKLMLHHDPVEGISAFIERRPPQWKHQ